MSTHVGTNIPQDDGRKSRDSEETMITNRSNHIPMSTHIATNMIAQMFVRIFFDQKSWMDITLQKVINLN